MQYPTKHKTFSFKVETAGQEQSANFELPNDVKSIKRYFITGEEADKYVFGRGKFTMTVGGQIVYEDEIPCKIAMSGAQTPTSEKGQGFFNNEPIECLNGKVVVRYSDKNSALEPFPVGGYTVVFTFECILK